MDKPLFTSTPLLPKPLTLWLSEAHFEEMVKEGESKTPLETGGILIGYWSESAAVVTAVIGPGRNAKHRRTSFLPDSSFHKEQIKELFEASDGVCIYLGDWHTHPCAAAYMSRLDRSTLARIANYDSAVQPRPIMLILAGNEEWLPKAWVRTKRSWWLHNKEEEVVIQGFVPSEPVSR